MSELRLNRLISCNELIIREKFEFSLAGVRMHILDNSTALRILASTWFIFAIVIYTTYTTNLISMLAVPDNSLPINVSFFYKTHDEK